MSCFKLSKRSIVFFVLLTGCFCFELGASAQKQQAADKSSTVAEVAEALDLAKFPMPQGALQVTAVRSGLYYTTTEDIDRVNANVNNEMLKRGFTEGESHRSKSATVTVLMDGRPGTIMLMNSIDGNLTHVTFYHHQGVDITKVPMLDHVGEIDRRVDETHYSTKIGVVEGQNLLRQKIDALGIKLARTSTGRGIAQTYFKNGIKFVSHVEESENLEFEMPRESSPKQTRVYLTSSGATDVTELPMPGRTEDLAQPYNSVFGTYKYVVTDKPQEAVKSCRSALQAAGWRPVKGTRETITDQQALLVRQGTLLQVDAKQYENGRTHVLYRLSMLPFDIPNDIETRLISVDTATPHMFFYTTASVNEVANFYSTHLLSLGWNPEGEKYEQAKSDEFRNLYRGSYYQPLLLNIVKQDPTSTWVELKPVDFSEVSKLFFAKKSESPVEAIAKSDPESEPATQEIPLAEASAQMDKGIENMMERQLETALQELGPEEAAEARKMFESTLKEALGGNPEVDETDTLEEPQTLSLDDDEMRQIESVTESAKAVVPADKIAAEDFPVPDDAQNVSRDFGMITFSTGKVEEQAKWLDQTLTDLGWKRRGEQMIENDMAILKFQKGTGTINASFILDDRRNPPVHTVIQGDGIYFADEDFGGVPMEAEEMEGFEGAEAGGGFGEGFEDQQLTEFEGMRLPIGVEDSVKSSTAFRKELTTSIESDVATVYEFFRKSAAESSWKQTTHVHNKDQNATINFTNDRGELHISLQRYDAEVEIHVVFRDPKIAEKQGFLPEPDQGRLILANASESPVTIRINTKTYQLAAGQGAENPKDGVILNVLPGGFNYTITGPKREEQSGKVKVEVGGTWGLVVFPQQGHMAERMY